jgi:hypothetical protein
MVQELSMALSVEGEVESLYNLILQKLWQLPQKEIGHLFVFVLIIR